MPSRPTGPARIRWSSSSFSRCGRSPIRFLKVLGGILEQEDESARERVLGYLLNDVDYRRAAPLFRLAATDRSSRIAGMAAFGLSKADRTGNLAQTLLENFGPDVSGEGASPDKLARLLGDDQSPVVREHAFRVLRKTRPAASDIVPHLVSILDQSSGDGVLWALRLLDDIGPAALPALPRIQARLRDGSPDVRAAAAAALGSIGPAAAAVALSETISPASAVLSPRSWESGRPPFRHSSTPYRMNANPGCA